MNQSQPSRRDPRFCALTKWRARHRAGCHGGAPWHPIQEMMNEARNLRENRTHAPRRAGEEEEPSRLSLLLLELRDARKNWTDSRRASLSLLLLLSKQSFVVYSCLYSWRLGWTDQIGQYPLTPDLESAWTDSPFPPDQPGRYSRNIRLDLFGCPRSPLCTLFPAVRRQDDVHIFPAT